MLEILNKILTNVLTAIYQPFWLSILLSVLFMFFRLYSHEEIGSGSKEYVHPRGYKQAVKDCLHTFKTSSTYRRIFYFTLSECGCDLRMRKEL